jgi:hypothetical protein
MSDSPREVCREAAPPFGGADVGIECGVVGASRDAGVWRDVGGKTGRAGAGICRGGTGALRTGAGICRTGEGKRYSGADRSVSAA